MSLRTIHGKQYTGWEHKDNMTTITDINTIEKISKQLRNSGKLLVVTGGCFDLLHIGHVMLLENAKKQGNILIVLLESDESIRKRKGINRPIHSQAERAHLVGSLTPVDIVVLLPPDMTDELYDQYIQKISPNIIAVTENDPAIMHKQRQARMVGAKVVTVNNYISSVSTSKLLDVLSKEL